MSHRSDMLVDARGVEFTMLRRPLRVVSLVPSITELLFDLGLGTDEVVGRTKFCVHPAQLVREIPVVGGTKSVHADRIHDLQPDLAIANIDENTREIVEELDGWKDEPWVYVTHPRTVDDALLMIRDLGILLDARSRAEELLAQIADARLSIPRNPAQSALYLIWRQPFMTVSPDTYIHSMLAEAGYRHVIGEAWLDARHLRGGARRYPELTAEDIAALRPEHILFSSEPYPFKEEHIAELREQLRTIDRTWAETVSMRIVDGEHYSWYGSRMREAFRAFSGL
ncbi:MAG: ABC transporter substrate-binding protein [Bacteroidetes bacterium]|nr:ABC transporter substrate-binding protein [Bacteroidota bacterium]